MLSLQLSIASLCQLNERNAMTVTELQILLDLNYENEVDVLDKYAVLIEYGCYLFVDSEDGQCYLFDKNGKMDDVKTLKVLYAGYVKKDIKKIAIPKHVEIIETYTFWNCKSLKSVEIPKSVICIGDWAFYNCTSLQNVEILEGVKSIGESAFRNCPSLKSIKIPDSVKSIGDGAFQYCTSLKSVKIPKSVKSIGESAFRDCPSLKEIIFKGKTMDQVKTIVWYPWGIEDESIIKCS